ncbi:MAG: carbohydrate ABC transporter permease [Ruthenibacterium lactatiformans]
MLRMTGKKKAGLQRMPVLFICVCVLPTLILTLLFTVIPTLRALWMSLFDSTALGMNSTFIGIENYLYMFQDDKFLQALGNTFKLLAVVPVITIVFALILAFMLSQTKLRERGLYRTVFYFPNIISLTVVGIIWSFVFHPNMGIVNSPFEICWVGHPCTSVGRRCKDRIMVYCRYACLAGYRLLYDHAYGGDGRYFQ